jgi:hypothetical protein
MRRRISGSMMVVGLLASSLSILMPPAAATAAGLCQKPSMQSIASAVAPTAVASMGCDSGAQMFGRGSGFAPGTRVSVVRTYWMGRDSSGRRMWEESEAETATVQANGTVEAPARYNDSFLPGWVFDGQVTIKSMDGTVLATSTEQHVECSCCW